MINGKFDYMQDSLDFCLYPDEIVERFTDREVIVCSANEDMRDAFVETFKDKLKIKYIANLKYVVKHDRFDCSPELDLSNVGGGVTQLKTLSSSLKFGRTSRYLCCLAFGGSNSLST